MQVMVTECPIKMGTPEWIPPIVTPVLVYMSCMYTLYNRHAPMHSGGLLQVAFA